MSNVAPAPATDRPIPKKRPFLVSSTRSPLADPHTPVHRLASSLQSVLYFPDPAPLYAVVATLAANTMQGYPVWLMLVGPPESGKTELLRPLLQLEGCREMGDVTGKGALLSGTKAKEVAADATGGLLKNLPRGSDGAYRGALVVLDFARTVLASEPVQSRATLGAIGQLHDQHYKRDIGTDGGKSLEFSGRIGFLAACTDVIDHPDHQQANAEMGERCLYYRYPESDGYHEINSALDNPDGTNKTKIISQLFGQFATDCNLDWSETAPPRPLTDEEKRRISALAQFCAKGRSGVQRDKYRRDEITGITRSALGPRIANSLAQLLRGCERVGCTGSETMQVLSHCAMDSLPATRSVCIRSLQRGIRSIGLISNELRISQSATKRTLEDLQVHGLVEPDRPDGGGLWRLSGDAERLLAAGGLQIDY